jgi:hypothetical protein
MSDKLLTDIYARLDTLEAVVLGGARGSSVSLSDRRLSKSEVAVRQGVDERTIDRWRKDPAKYGNFPKPDIINGRCFWWLSVLQRHERKRARAAAAATRHRGHGGRFTKTTDNAAEA